MWWLKSRAELLFTGVEMPGGEGNWAGKPGLLWRGQVRGAQSSVLNHYLYSPHASHSSASVGRPVFLQNQPRSPSTSLPPTGVHNLQLFSLCLSLSSEMLLPNYSEDSVNRRNVIVYLRLWHHSWYTKVISKDLWNE